MLTLILGGARSGKSRLAQRLAGEAGRVIYVATAEAGGDDHEMRERIAHHRKNRPAEWQTIEEPLELAGAIEGAAQAAGGGAILADCLTLWLSNLFANRRAEPEGIEDAWRASLRRIAGVARTAQIILVSNEVGSGTVPEAALTRAFRDAQGQLNQHAAELADEVILTVAGLPVYLKRPIKTT